MTVVDDRVYWSELTATSSVSTNGKMRATVDDRPDCHTVRSYRDKVCWLALNEVVCREGESVPKVVHRRDFGLFEGLALSRLGAWFGLDASSGTHDLGVYLYEWETGKVSRVVASLDGIAVMDASDRDVYFRIHRPRALGDDDVAFYRATASHSAPRQFLAAARMPSIMRVWEGTAYFTDYLGRSVYSVPTGGGAPSLELDTVSAPTCLGVGERWIAWCTSYGVYVAPRAGGAPVLLAVDHEPAAVVVSENVVYWVSASRVGRVRLHVAGKESGGYGR